MYDEISDDVYKLPILVVDDDAVYCELVHYTLSLKGFKNVYCVYSGEEALEQLDAFRPDLIIMDAKLPGMSGMECCRRIRLDRKNNAMPILFHTSVEKENICMQAFAAGATDLIVKPLLADELYARVKVHLQNHSLHQHTIKYRERVANELESARQLQLSILPQPAEIEGLRKSRGLDIASYFRPSSELGGDYWGVKSLPKDQTVLWLVDFSGHGVASAIHTFRLHSYLMEIVEHSAEHTMSAINDKLGQMVMRGQFATMFYGVVDTGRNILHYSCASCPNPIVLPAKEPPFMLDGTGLPLGICAQNYERKTIPFREGDCLILYSDALIETRSSSEQFMTEDDILAYVKDFRFEAAEQIKDGLLKLFRQHAASAPVDDLTLCVVKRVAHSALEGRSIRRFFG